MADLISDVMTTDVVTVEPTTPAPVVARIILNRRLRSAPVVDRHRQVVGMISEADLLKRQDLSLTEGSMPRQRRSRAQLASMTAQDVMTSPAITVFPADTLNHAARVMHRRRIGRLPVVDDGQLVGIVSRGDLLRALLRLDDDLQTTVNEVITSAPGTAGLHALVRDGVVTLEGTATTTAVVTAVADRLRAIPGLVRLDVTAGGGAGRSRGA